jgi:hypothetical protein
MDAVPLPDGEPRSPEPVTAEEITRYVVAAAVWAPSVHNTQPWQFTTDCRQISLHADAKRQLRVADPEGREMMISCGSALFTARLALRSLGYIPQASVLPDPAQPLLVARVSWSRSAACTELEQQLFGQVRQRRTHRGGFDLGPLPPGLLAALRQGAAQNGAMLRIIADDGRRAALAAAVETAEHVQRLDSERVRELARWAPAPGSARADGVPPTSYPARADHTDPDFPGRDFAHGRSWGCRRSARRRRSSPQGSPRCSPQPETTHRTGSMPGRRCSGFCSPPAPAGSQPRCTASRSSLTGFATPSGHS